MKHRIALIFLVLGILLMLAALVIPLISMAKVDVIGGAGWPTYTFFFCKTSWIGLVGGCLAAVPLVMHLIHKK